MPDTARNSHMNSCCCLKRSRCCPNKLGLSRNQQLLPQTIWHCPAVKVLQNLLDHIP